MNNYIKEIRAIIILSLFVLTICGLFYMIEKFKIEKFILIGIGINVFMLLIFSQLKAYIHSRIFSKILNILSIPTSILYVLLNIIIPFGFLFVHVIMYMFLCWLMPIVLYKITCFFDNGIIKNASTLLYIELTLTVFIAVLFNYQIRKIIYTISPARINHSEKLKPFKIDKLTDYLLSENNVRFLIYSIYVFLLFIINFYNFEDNFFSKDLINDKAILQSFVTFIAFERAVTLLKQLEFKPSDLLEKIINSIANNFRNAKKNSE